MKKLMLAGALVLAGLSKAYSQFCPSCIQNSAVPQEAQFNITSATVRGPLAVNTIVGLSAFTAASSMTAPVFIGSGTYLTNLNASQLLFGTVPSAAMSGSYPGITSIGTVANGVWKGAIIGSQYGGTGSNLVTSGIGSIPYFSSVGTMSVVAHGTATQLLQTNGEAAPSWTGVPQVLGTNITGIPMANLIPGQLPMSISIDDASISTVSAAKVIGNIPGNATNITGVLPISHLGSGTLNTSNPASSVTASGVTPGIWGGPSQLIQATVGYDGRITAISQSSFTVNVGSITAGPLPVGVTIGAAQITAGTLATSVIAQTLPASGVTAGSYGSGSQVSSFTVRADGRISSANQIPIAINTSQINNGTLTGGVLVPAANVQAGPLGGGVIASSISATGFPAGTYGGASNSLQVNIGVDGRVLSATQFVIPGLSTSVVLNNVDNGWVATQTFFSSATVKGNLSANNFVATTLTGIGSGLTSIPAGSILSGQLSGGVIASSIAVNSVSNAQVAQGSFANIKGVGPLTSPLVVNATAAFTGSDANGNVASFGSNVGSQSIAVLANTGSTALVLFSTGAASAAAGSVSYGQLNGDWQTCMSNPQIQTPSANVRNLCIDSTLNTINAHAPVLADSSVTASAFFGDGSHLTSLSTSSFTGGTVANATTFLSSVNASAFFGNGAGINSISLSTSVVIVGPGPGSNAQFKSVAAAVAALGTPTLQTDVMVLPGTYNEQPFSLPSNIALLGPYAGRATLLFVSTGAAITVAGTTGNNISALLITNTGGGPAIEITGQSSTNETVIFSQITGRPALLLDTNARPITSQASVWTTNGSSAPVVINGTFGTGAAAAQNTFDFGSQITAIAGQDCIDISTPVVMAIRDTSMNLITTGKYSINATVPVAIRYGQMTVVGGGCPAQNLCVSSNTTFGTSAAPYNFNPGANAIAGVVIPPSPIDGQFLVGASSTSAKWTNGNGVSSIAPANSLFVDSSGNVVIGQFGSGVNINVGQTASTTTINGQINMGSVQINSGGLTTGGPAGQIMHIGGNTYIDSFGNMTMTGSTVTLQVLNGQGGFLTAQSSVTASAFFGDGSHLTGIPTPNVDNAFVASQTFLSTVTIKGGSFAVVSPSTWGVTGGFLGVGTSTPSFVVDILGTTGNTAMMRTIEQGSIVDGLRMEAYFPTNTAGANGNYIVTRAARGTQDAPTAVGVSDFLYANSYRGHNGSAFPGGPNANYIVQANENFTTAANGTEIRFKYTPNGTVGANAFTLFTATSANTGGAPASADWLMGYSLIVDGSNNVLSNNFDVRASSTGDIALIGSVSTGTLTFKGGSGIGTAPLSVALNAPTNSLRVNATGQVSIGSATANAGDGLTVANSSMTVDGLIHAGWEHVLNSCGAGVTTCTATCSAGNYATGGGCNTAAVIGVAVLTGDTGDNSSHTCTTVTATTITADVYCSRLAP